MTGEILKDRHGNPLAWKDCPQCGRRVLILARATYCSVSCSKKGKKRPEIAGENHPRWVADDISYNAAHLRVRNARGPADHCEKCAGGTVFQWAFNNTGDRGDPFAYMSLCITCHREFDHDLLPVGSRNGLAKLTEEIVRECRQRCAAGELKTNLAREFGVSTTAMSAAVDGRTWKHVHAR